MLNCLMSNELLIYNKNKFKIFKIMEREGLLNSSY